MKVFLGGYGFPLLGKELTEQAARKRTYLTRVFFTCFFFLTFLIPYHAFYSKSVDRSVVEILGSGQHLFEGLIEVQLVAIYLFVPAMMAGAIAHEKERGSLHLLLLTHLRPGEIVLEKLISRLIPALSLQLAALPLMAIVYSLGGVSETYFWAGIYLVFLASLQVGSFTLMLSAYYRTTAEAFVLTYVLGAGLSFCCLGIIYPPMIFSQLGNGSDLWQALLISVPAIVSIVVFLSLARVYLIQRANVPAKNYLLSFFRVLDDAMHQINKDFGNIVLIKDQPTLPDDEPVAWRERTKRALGKLHYLIRVLLAIEVPVLFIAAITASDVFSRSVYNPATEALSVTVLALWGLMILALGAAGSQLINSERTRQTLGVLLATPLPRREILQQKVRGLRRLTLLFWIPFLTLSLIEAWLEHPHGRGKPQWQGLSYLLSSSLLVLIFQPMFLWLGVLTGLKAKSPLRTVLYYLGVVLLWLIGPGVLHAILSSLGVRADLLLLLSPATMILSAEGLPVSPMSVAGLHDSFPFWMNFLIFAGILYVLRNACLRNADRYLLRLL